MVWCMCSLDPHKLGIHCRLNGKIVQNSNTEHLVHKTEALVAFISRSAIWSMLWNNSHHRRYASVFVYSESVVFPVPATPSTLRFMTLEPGDVVLTGTPPGVGCFRKPPLWMKVTCTNCLMLHCYPVLTSPQKGDVVECEIDEIGRITNYIQ